MALFVHAHEVQKASWKQSTCHILTSSQVGAMQTV